MRQLDSAVRHGVETNQGKQGRFLINKVMSCNFLIGKQRLIKLKCSRRNEPYPGTVGTGFICKSIEIIKSL